MRVAVCQMNAGGGDVPENVATAVRLLDEAADGGAEPGPLPGPYRGRMTLGAEIVCVPSAFTEVTGRAHWEVLLRARAIEEQCFILAPAQWGPWGRAEDGRRTYGNSIVVDPWGEVLVRAPHEGDGVWLADLDMAKLQHVRQTLPALQHRRLGPVC